MGNQVYAVSGAYVTGAKAVAAGIAGNPLATDKYLD
jgi:hypothetical protein